MTTVSVNTPYQVVYEATVHTAGQTAAVPADVADKWIDAGWGVQSRSRETCYEGGATETDALRLYGQSMLVKACLHGAHLRRAASAGISG
jgi:hypothetical protein